MYIYVYYCGHFQVHELFGSLDWMGLDWIGNRRIQGHGWMLTSLMLGPYT
jgi:hypothetical protein